MLLTDRRTSRRMFSIVAVLGLAIGFVGAVAPSTQAKSPARTADRVLTFREGTSQRRWRPRRPRHVHSEPRRKSRAAALPWVISQSSLVTGRQRDRDLRSRLSRAGVPFGDHRQSGYRNLPRTADGDPNLSTGCTWWSPDGMRLACEGTALGVIEPHRHLHDPLLRRRRADG